jgi:DNA-binding GntR family transcriptional regulator
MAELYWLRIAVEREVALGSRKPSETEARLLRALYETTLASFGDGDHRSIIAADRDFYFAVYDLSSRTLLLREAKRLWDLSAIYRQSAVELALSTRPELDRLAKRRRQQFTAVIEGDRFALAEFIVSDRRSMIEYFKVDEFVPGR